MGGESFIAINGKTGAISMNFPGYSTWQYSDEYVTIPFTSTYGMTTYATAKQKFKYSYGTKSDSVSSSDSNKTATSGEKIVPNNQRADGAYTSLLIIY